MDHFLCYDYTYSVERFHLGTWGPALTDHVLRSDSLGNDFFLMTTREAPQRCDWGTECELLRRRLPHPSLSLCRAAGPRRLCASPGSSKGGIRLVIHPHPQYF